MSRLVGSVLLGCICLVATATAVQTQPWGRLEIAPIVIAPPQEYIPFETGPVHPARWHFPNLPAEQFRDALTALGLAPDVVTRIVEGARLDASTKTLVFEPDKALLVSLPPDVRAKLYFQLGRNPLNFDQAAAYYSYGGSIDTWLGGPEVTPPAIRALVDPLVYKIGAYLYFADIEFIRSEIGPGPEYQKLVRRLLRQQTMFVSLSVDDEDELDTLEEYWGRGGRHTDIRPLLESVVDNVQSIRISELLPDLPRRLLYRYPKVRAADLEQPELANCFWTALNFFNDVPDDRFLDVRVAMNTLKSDYFLVPGRQQMGDIAVFSHGTEVFHVAVYLADDLVFTKNGAFNLAPWIIMPIDRLKGPYVAQTDDWKVTFYRRKGL